MLQSQMVMSTGTLRMLQDCSSMCNKMCDVLLNRQDVHQRRHQLKLLADCASICELCAKFVAGNSLLMKSICEYCAYVCEVCGNECLKHPDQESQMCGQMCLNCARECRSLAMQLNYSL
jgi:hypothetical protein